MATHAAPHNRFEKALRLLHDIGDLLDGATQTVKSGGRFLMAVIAVLALIALSVSAMFGHTNWQTLLAGSPEVIARIAGHFKKGSSP